MDGNFPDQIASVSKGTIDFSRQGDSIADLTGEVHQLPCCIKHDGPTSVSHYFKPKPTGVEIDGLKVEEAYFRGRKLQGTTVNLPQGYSGSILGKKTPANVGDESSGDRNSWELHAKFGSMTVWNHDSFPSKDDAFMRAFHWFDVAEVLHKPVTVEDLEAVNIPDELDCLSNNIFFIFGEPATYLFL